MGKGMTGKVQNGNDTKSPPGGAKLNWGKRTKKGEVRNSNHDGSHTEPPDPVSRATIETGWAELTLETLVTLLRP